MLFGRDDIEPDKPDKNGRTPLRRAAKKGREGVVKILLGREGVNPDKPDNGGQTPLSCHVREQGSGQNAARTG